MKTSIWIADDLYKELKKHKAPIPTIIKEALENWLATDSQAEDPTDSIRLIETGARRLRQQINTKSTTPKQRKTS